MRTFRRRSGYLLANYRHEEPLLPAGTGAALRCVRLTSGNYVISAKASSPEQLASGLVTSRSASLSRTLPHTSLTLHSLDLLTSPNKPQGQVPLARPLPSVSLLPPYSPSPSSPPHPSSSSNSPLPPPSPFPSSSPFPNFGCPPQYTPNFRTFTLTFNKHPTCFHSSSICCHFTFTLNFPNLLSLPLSGSLPFTTLHFQ